MYNLKKRFTDSKYTERIFKGTRCKYLHNRPISFFDFTLQTHSPLPIFMIWRLLILEIEPFAFDSFYGSAILQFPWQHVKYDDKTTNFTLQPILRLSILRLSTFQFRPISLCILEIDHFTIHCIVGHRYF